MTTITGNITTDVAELLALMVEPAGFNLKINALELAPFIEQVVGNPPPMDYDSIIPNPELGIEWYADPNGWFTRCDVSPG